ncbi:bifunctional adenosylcobinamide kinase/adenosylcobinamide-phosphate guanylyltransferase [Bacillus sp. SG-1]|uniref:bifunctional adenosylcobinamide kinase/adenosylcobinamide-phosphate guanylyltransferase n=1 Tax=Bacillus sp. SG-1 TaxID=161544 RepID=UPI00015441AD|nr:bifunctional adenosylcobinamide kinase/adenosylcobinamide-phosphate guanylyltransferase [Bacillus sp. SG-1]EDL66223.1 bifunctional cobalamin biosynthesis protein (cobinamide kinase; cobinamide phosphate guanylyltransferase) [Bacillus sp. SG-1]
MAAEVIFVCGGVRSGKSSFAESKAAALSKMRSGTLHYIACGKAIDEEMKQRIDRHQQDRKNSNAGWTTWEQATSLGEIAENFSDKDIILVDCITTWMTNEIYLENIPAEDVTPNVMRDINKVAAKAGTLFLVSNDVFCEPLSENEWVKRFTSILGTLHQEIVSMADTAYSVKHGVAIVKKEKGKTC